MASKDMHNHLGINSGVLALDIQLISTDTTTVGAIIDTDGFESLEFLLASGTLTDGAYAVLVEHGDDSGLSDAAAVSDDMLLSTEALSAFALTEDDEVKKLGYIGDKRYVRLSIVSTATTVGGTIGVIGILGNAHTLKVA